MKVIIFGFPHCGTSILKSIIGHCEDVHETINESLTCKDDKYKFNLCKHPFFRDEFFSEKYDEYIKIFIIRNPVYVYSSINKRYNNKIPDDHNIDKYIKVLKKFKETQCSERVFKIRYEDFFENNFKNIKNILDKIGIKYTDEIFDNTKYTNYIINTKPPPTNKPKNTEHGLYRTWQINQPFVNFNSEENINLTSEQKQKITGSDIIKEVYPDIHI